MVLLHIGGIEVDFPYEPYGVQKQYMSRVIAALRAGSNACLESPTGTGKSLSLLCSVLAWRQAYVAALQLRANGGYDEKLFRATGVPPPGQLPTNSSGAAGVAEDGLQGSANGAVSAGSEPAETGVAESLMAAVMPNAGRRDLRAPRIVFTSRTHSQLSQAIGELKATVYRPYMTVLASRDQLCVHDVARKLSGPRLNSACRNLTSQSKRGCKYHLSVMSPRDHENRSTALLQELKDDPPKDIEDLGSFGLQEGACPWYLTRAAAATGEVEIIFMPYNYLIDRSARESIDLDWGNDVIIVDEAHNLESVCTDSISFDLTPSIRAGCQKELVDCIEGALRPGGVSFPALEELAKSKEGEGMVIGTENREATEYRVLLVMLRKIEEAIESVSLSNQGSGDDARRSANYASFPGSFFRNLLCSVDGFSEETVPLVLEVLEKAVDDSSGSDRSQNKRGSVSEASSSISCLRVFLNALKLVFEPGTARFEEGFRTVIQLVDSSNPALGRSISVWCFDPAVAMSQLVPLGVRSLVLTSGTLSPMDSFSSELGVAFPVRLESRHVIGPKQVFGTVVSSGPDGFRLSSNFKVREKDEYKLSLGRTLISLASVIPDGILVFFPSYRAMEGCSQFWRSVGVGEHGQRPSIVELLYQRKQLVWEPRNSGEFAAAILAHQNHIRSGRGSILFAVCRGKVSEGIDFSDAYGRAVVLAGIPYPAAFDPKVLLKKEYMDEKKRRNALCSSEKRSVDEQRVSRPVSLGVSQGMANAAVLASGDEWYSLQAVRAINQALGRVIRHKNDFGCVLLCDERFSSSSLQTQLSKWLKPFMSVSPSFSSALSRTTEFFLFAKNSSFAAARSVKAPPVRALSETSIEKNWRNPKRELQQVDTDAQIAAASEAIAKFLEPRRFGTGLDAEVFESAAKIRKLSPNDNAAASKSQPMEDINEEERLLNVLGGRPSAGSRPRVMPSSSNVGVHEEVLNASTTMGRSTSSNCAASEVRVSSEFLRQRQKRKAQEKGEALIVRNTSNDEVRVCEASTSSGLPSRRPKVSDAAKALFDDKKHFTATFLSLRRILALAREFAENEGPLVSSARREEVQAQGRLEVVALVDCIKCNCGARVTTAQVRSFLEMLRPKIPEPFLAAFDAVVAIK